MQSDHRVSSETLQAEIHVLACGHGDTLLLRLPVDRWILVDCHLRNRSTRRRFFDFVESHNIRRLEYIFQTHPDFDHYCGMTAILKYFTSDGRSVGYWCDSGVNALQIRDLLATDEFSEREYTQLHDLLDELASKKLIQTVAVNDWSRPISPRGYTGRVDLFPIAPSGDVLRQVTRRNVRKVAGGMTARLEANAISVVLLLAARGNSDSCNMLLSGDAWKNELESAMTTWARRAKENGHDVGLDVVKVPHHGSVKSHWSALCTQKSAGATAHVAAISAGTRKGLPDRAVIRDYLEQQWIVLVTTSRKAHAEPNWLMDIADVTTARDYALEEHDIKASWKADEGVIWEPEAAVVDAHSLKAYETNV